MVFLIKTKSIDKTSFDIFFRKKFTLIGIIIYEKRVVNNYLNLLLKRIIHTLNFDSF